MGANIFDLIVIVLLAFSAYKGYGKGLIASAASLIALLLGVWGAIKFSSITSGFLSDVIDVDQKYMNIIAFAVTFVIIVVGVHFIARAIEGLANAVALSMLNKVAGSAFGVLKTAFIISVVIVIINAANAKFSFIDVEFKKDSLFYEPIAGIAPSIFDYLNFDDIRDEVEEQTKKIKI